MRGLAGTQRHHRGRRIAGPILGLAMTVLAGVNSAGAQAPPTPPHGWLKGKLEWNVEVIEDGWRIQRAGSCAFWLEFGVDGTSHAVTLSYVSTDTRRLYADLREIETIEGRQPDRRPIPGRLTITRNRDGSYYAQYQNPTYEASTTIHRETLIGGRWTRTSPPEPGPLYQVHCNPSSFTANVLDHGTLGPRRVSSVQLKQLIKQVPFAMLTLEWRLRAYLGSGSCPPGLIAEQLGDFTWCRNPPGTLRR